MRKTETIQCLECQKAFKADLRELKRGRAQFCSLGCAGKHNGEKRRRAHEPNVKCALCEEPFYKSQHKQTRSKSGLFFCSRAHKDEAQRIGGIKEIMPAHYGATAKNYRQIALRELSNSCSRCGYDRHVEILHVHHINRNRADNTIANLEILCPTCHEAEHFRNRDGKWRMSRN